MGADRGPEHVGQGHDDEEERENSEGEVDAVPMRQLNPAPL